MSRMKTNSEIFNYFLANGVICPTGEKRSASMGTISTAFIVAYQTGTVHKTIRKGTPAHAAARAGLRRRIIDQQQ